MHQPYGYDPARSGKSVLRPMRLHGYTDEYAGPLGGYPDDYAQGPIGGLGANGDTFIDTTDGGTWVDNGDGTYYAPDGESYPYLPATAVPYGMQNPFQPGASSIVGNSPSAPGQGSGSANFNAGGTAPQNTGDLLANLTALFAGGSNLLLQQQLVAENKRRAAAGQPLLTAAQLTGGVVPANIQQGSALASLSNAGPLILLGLAALFFLRKR